jgi:hypothetical protein
MIFAVQNFVCLSAVVHEFSPKADDNHVDGFETTSLN